MSANIDPYEVLGVPHTATSTEVNRAYRTLLRALHPDTHMSAGNLATPADATRLADVVAAYAELRVRDRRHHDGGNDTHDASASSPPPSAPPQPSAMSAVRIPIRYRTNTFYAPYPRRPPLWVGPVVVVPHPLPGARSDRL